MSERKKGGLLAVVGSVVVAGEVSARIPPRWHWPMIAAAYAGAAMILAASLGLAG